MSGLELSRYEGFYAHYADDHEFVLDYGNLREQAIVELPWEANSGRREMIERRVSSDLPFPR